MWCIGGVKPQWGTLALWAQLDLPALLHRMTHQALPLRAIQLLQGMTGIEHRECFFT